MKTPSYVPKFYTSKFFLYLWEIKLFALVYLLGKQMYLTNLVVQEVETHRAKRVLQMGSVPGPLSKKIAQTILKDGKLCIVDVSKNALDLARKKTDGLANVELIEANASDTKLPSRIFDTVVIYFLLHEVPKEVKFGVLHEADRLLEKGGIMIIVDYHKMNNGWFRSIIEKIVRRVEPFSGELIGLDLPKILTNKGFDVEKTVLANSGLYQFVVAKKR